jgi:hypothetical protein
MARVQVNVIEHLSTQVRKALATAVKETLPPHSVDEQPAVNIPLEYRTATRGLRDQHGPTHR